MHQLDKNVYKKPHPELMIGERYLIKKLFINKKIEKNTLIVKLILQNLKQCLKKSISNSVSTQARVQISFIQHIFEYSLVISFVHYICHYIMLSPEKLSSYIDY